MAFYLRRTRYRVRGAAYTSIAVCLAMTVVEANGGSENFESRAQRASSPKSNELPKEPFRAAFKVQPKLTPNPSRKVPLAALLEFETREPARAVVAIIDGDNRRTVKFADKVQTKHRLTILGLKPGRGYRFELALRDAKGRIAKATDDLRYDTPKLPNDFPPIETVISKPEKMEPGITMFNAFQWINDVANENLGYIVALDASGDVVWFYRADHPISDVKRLRNGNLLYLRQHRVHAWTEVVEIDMLGTVVRGWFAGKRVSRGKGPRGGTRLNVDTLHHDVVETPNGTFRAITTEVRKLRSFPTSETNRASRPAPANVVGDTIVEFQPSGKIVKRWRLHNLLDTQRIGYGSLSRFWDSRVYRGYARTGGTRDWSHANSLQYIAQSGSMIVSSRHQDTILKIDGKTNKVAWILANPVGWRPYWRKLLLKPVGRLSWPYHQHSPKLTSTGRLLVYDNGNYRATPFAPKLPATQNSTRVVEFAIDEKAMTVRQTWEYRGDKSRPYYCPLFGDADLLKTTGNVLITDGGMLTDAANRRTDKIPADRQWARIVEVDRKNGAEKVFEIHIGNDRGGKYGWSVYRGERLPGLYAPMSDEKTKTKTK